MYAGTSAAKFHPCFSCFSLRLCCVVPPDNLPAASSGLSLVEARSSHAAAAKHVLQDEPENPEKQHRPDEDEERKDVLADKRESPAPPQQGDRKRTEHCEKERQDNPRTLPGFELHGRGVSFYVDGSRRTAAARRAGRRAATATIVVARVEHGVALETDRFHENGVVHGQNPSTPRGVEQIAHSSENQGSVPQGGANFTHFSGDSAPIDPALMTVVAATVGEIARRLGGVLFVLDHGLRHSPPTGFCPSGTVRRRCGQSAPTTATRGLSESVKMCKAGLRSVRNGARPHEDLAKNPGKVAGTLRVPFASGRHTPCAVRRLENLQATAHGVCRILFGV